MAKKKLITSALPYVNNEPHLGNIIGCVLSADVYARFCRSQGYETLYICATDEYGTATENKAREEGLTPKEICDKYHQVHKRVYDDFNISFDFFGRTSHPEHIEITQEIFKDLEKNNLVVEEESEQTYCQHDQMFLADRYVEGICPHCGSAGARGDQCDACGKLLQPTDLKDPKCQVCGNTPIRKATKHLYLTLPLLAEQLKGFLARSSTAGKWATNAVTLTEAWLDKGLINRPITRDLRWGVPVPRTGYENKVFYVWFDAPIGYISATIRHLPEDWKSWWHDPQGTQLYQFMAKDNIPFHTVIFPAALMGSGQPWTLLHHIASTEYLNYESDKFSKSRSKGVFGTDVRETGIPVDLWRFYLLYNRPEKSDTNFTWDGFLEDVNSNFIDNIGNLLNRVLVFYTKNFPEPIGDLAFRPQEEAFLAEVRQGTAQAVEALEGVQLREGLKAILAMGKAGNKYFHEAEPWALIKQDEEATKSVLAALLILVRELGILLLPYMPQTAEDILKMLGENGASHQELGQWDNLKQQVFGPPSILHKKLVPKEIAAWKERFMGDQVKRPAESNPLEAWQEVELKVGEIKSIQPHPTAERLYVEEIDLGEGRLRTIVSGLVKHYQPEELLGKRVVVVANLAPADLRGVRSEGMLLAAEKKKKLEVLFTQAAPGTPVHLAGEEPKSNLPEISIDRFFEAKLEVKNHQVELAGKALVAGGEALVTKEVEQGKVG